MLRTFKDEQLREQSPSPLSPRSQVLATRTEAEMLARLDETSYSAKELPAVVHHARNTPNFIGLAALELYAEVAQQLSGDNYRQWMADGLGYFDLGKRHPC